MLELNAKAVFVGRQDEYGLFMVALGEEEDGTGDYLIIQRADEFDEQDRELGEDTYCIVGPGQVTHYGGVVDWSCSEGRVRLVVSAQAAETLGTATELVVRFPATETERVRGGLEVAIDGHRKP